MNLVVVYSLSLSVFISLSSADELLSFEHSGLNCVPTNCGNVTNISYPFWVENQQPSYCGFPSFKLTCENQTLNLANSAVLSLRVKNIFYENRSILVVDETFAGLQCGVTHWSLYFNLTLFTISPANKKLVFLYNCRKKPPSNCYKINCTSGADITYAVWGTDLTHPECEMCNQSSVPVAGYMSDNIHNYLKAVNYGFLLDWSATDCKECENSHGQCGYNETYNGFMCICPDGPHRVKCHPDSEKKGTLEIVIGVVAGIGGVLLGTCIVLFLCVRRKRKLKANPSNLLSQTASSILSSKMNTEAGEPNYNTHIFTYEELEEATHGFDGSRELGDGGFGTVYKGKLRDGRTVAVKRLYENNYRRLKQFMNEVEILSHLRHQNLVTLYGCTSPHSHELLLVYEYIANGTLADHLHGPLASKGGLPWPTRMSIIIQTAEALVYLHSAEPQIIHRDIKTTNILVDGNFQVKVADFGLSRLFPLDATHVSTAPQGTPGYVDPEYHLCFQLTDKSDVYSFGVVLIELISSKPAVDISRHRHEINLANMAIAKIQNSRIGELVDPELGYGSDLEVTRMINQVAELAFTCLQPDGEMRPGIKEVLSVLRCIKGDVDADGVDSPVKEESKLLKNVVPFSPDSVTGRWSSRSTAPNAST